MKVVVISLEGSSERRASSKKQLDHLSIPFEFLDGIDGRSSNSPLLDRYDERKFLINYGRPANPGELGCYASHFLAWKRCVEMEEPLLVLEDDFLLTEGFPEALILCTGLIHEYGYIRLEKTTRSMAVRVRDVEGFSLVKYVKAPQGALCYGIAPFVAGAFIRHSREFVYPVDVFVRHFWLHKVPLFGLRPYTATQSELALDSIIGRRERYRKPLWTGALRFLAKVFRLMMTGKENLLHAMGYREARKRIETSRSDPS